MKLYQRLAQLFDAQAYCAKSGNTEWETNHRRELERLVAEYLPHGSGIDNGIKFNWDKSRKNKLVFDFDFHAMDGNGYYAGYDFHRVIVTPSLMSGYDLRITGRDYTDDKEYFYDVFSDALDTEI